MTPDDWREVYAATWLAYVRDVAGWAGPAPEPASTTPAKPHPGTGAWYYAMFEARRRNGQRSHWRNYGGHRG